MPKLHLFNPSHEMALAANVAQYTPTKHVAQMERDKCRFPLQWAAADDFVLTPDGIIDTMGNIVPLSADMVPAPWGWNKAVKQRFMRLGIDPQLMPTDDELDLWRAFASRRWAAQICKELYSTLHDTTFVVDNHMCFCDTDELLNAWLTENEGQRYILKNEYSSSGRGNSIDRRQKAPVLADRFYDKAIDFALEYEMTETEVRYLGLSVFKASTSGRYECNYCLPQPQLHDMIVEHIPSNGSRRLTTLVDIYRALLSTHLLHRYRGIVGIDMLVTQDGLIHPCIEINLRMNMGVVAILTSNSK